MTAFFFYTNFRIFESWKTMEKKPNGKKGELAITS